MSRVIRNVAGSSISSKWATSRAKLTSLDGQRGVPPLEPEGVADLLAGRIEPRKQSEENVVILVNPETTVRIDAFVCLEGTYEATAIWKLANSEEEAMDDESKTFSASDPDPVRANASNALETPAYRSLLTVASLASWSITMSSTVPSVLLCFTSVNLHATQ